jgi:anti-sigma factor RsiW
MSDRFTEQLSPYLDGELDALAAARLEQHLGECLDCTRTLAELRAIVAAAPG